MISIDLNGDLVVTTTDGEIRERNPIIYQEEGTGRVRVAGRYRKLTPHSVRFEVDRYDASKLLVIDPPVSYPLTSAEAELAR